MMLRRFALASVLLIASSVTPAMAAPLNTSNLYVSANVVANCIINTNAVVFGDYDPIVGNSSAFGADLDQTGTVTTLCTSGSEASISLDQGLNDATGTLTAPERRLSSGSSNYLSYNLYSDSARGTVWGSTGVAPAGDDGTLQTTTVFGRIPKGQNAVKGNYSDTVVATVNF
ncbi:Csu type fimbrial protein [Nostoc sp.]|uniref:Csu type fimbrial protein n=1 Tax=Nostoc sp. TaxID=1180 RepID=UPI002FF5961F